MRILLTLAVLSLIGCKSEELPTFPPIKDHYLVDVKNGVVKCVKYPIHSLRPYKLGPGAFVALEECDQIGGYKPTDIQGFLNWVDDMYDWAKDKEVCQQSRSE